MSQSRRMSLTEAIVGTAIGFVVSVLIGLLVYPLFGHAFTLTENIGITAVYTIASVVRSYLVRRGFNSLRRAAP
ncbi:DUF7220 family protein [Propionivibrio dicarboxylicus]|uniref:Uncharacterized protein n=1 Tax=Propionivibrio dicarboxylicus TaxID=83767 RepID=A0A1G8ARM7_9RHOO|nr:hypothetical protein [Propionivibrio dicarboxylicus]SDH23589.1 hypothetical protein SAMN05660652_01475 [Propionivibrio dicarboxylicus]